MLGDLDPSGRIVDAGVDGLDVHFLGDGRNELFRALAGLRDRHGLGEVHVLPEQLHLSLIQERRVPAGGHRGRDGGFGVAAGTQLLGAGCPLLLLPRQRYLASELRLDRGVDLSERLTPGHPREVDPGDRGPGIDPALVLPAEVVGHVGGRAAAKNEQEGQDPTHEESLLAGGVGTPPTRARGDHFSVGFHLGSAHPLSPFPIHHVIGVTSPI